MIKKILIFLGLVFVLLLIYVALSPSEMMIERQMLVKAPVEKIFPYINNAKKSYQWMPWSEEDPNVKIQYSGAAEGVGAISSWDSSGKMGTGKAEVIESVLNEYVKTQLTYTRPMQMSQVALIRLKPTQEGVMVTWSVTGKNSFIGRFFCLFLNMDKVVGAQFEKGLKNLNRLVHE